MKSFFEKLKDFLKKLFIFWGSILERLKILNKMSVAFIIRENA